ncbi:PREDICTED: uncharacterized protein LOC108361629 [Rhagoletis zephyria]|uniref:uncharacterized protein LOC108361629 n=1 Tax=Rhagoletis zephyria TaxID=28612 RepID=UPI0008115CF8|nr:PREDICTED: uncharacterized protein LOC108361629 [Rhagoletis zephyria]
MENQGTSENPAEPSEKIRAGVNKANKSEDCEAQIHVGSCNPSVHPDGSEHVDEDLTRIRGDAIGNTLYSERFVLSTLLKLTKVEKELAENECFENDLCSVWDMTIEEDVVLLLLEHNVLELFAHCINATEDKRLVEILVGILGNMCNFKEAREALVENNNLVQILLGLTSCSDSLTLLQLTRLLSVVLIHADRAAALQWYQRICTCPDFVKNITFILNNSINEQLLRQTIETLNAILAKFALVEPNPQKPPTNEGDDLDRLDPLPTFEQLFVEQNLIKATTEAFLALLPRKDTTELQDNDEDDDESTILPTQSTHNLMQIFLNIHGILTQYDDLSRNSYKPYIESLLDCLGCILEPLCNPKYVPHLSNREQDLLDSINDVFESLGDPFDEICLMYAIRIWNLLREENERIARKTTTANDFEDNTIKEDDFNFETSYLTILDLIVRMVNAATEVQLQEFLKENNDDNLKNLQSALSIEDNDQPTRLCYSKIQISLENIHKN